MFVLFIILLVRMKSGMVRNGKMLSLLKILFGLMVRNVLLFMLISLIIFVRLMVNLMGMLKRIRIIKVMVMIIGYFL